MKKRVLLMVSSKVLDIEDVSKSYGKIQALNKASFVVPKGKVAGLVGPNGAGKTTLVKCMTGFLSYEGHIEVMGVSEGMKKKEIGYLPEEDGFYTRLTGEEYLKYFADLDHIKDGKEVVNEKLELVGLAERKDDLVKSYSHGMKRRLGVARTLLHEPSLLIYDEPLSGLDPLIKKKILDIIQDIIEEDRSFLISSHQLNDIDQICDWVVLVRDGEIIDYGPPENVSDSRKSTKEFVFKVDEKDISKVLEIKEDIEIVMDVEQNGTTVVVKGLDKEGLDKKVLRWMIEKDIDFSLKQGSLDSMYRSVFK